MTIHATAGICRGVQGIMSSYVQQRHARVLTKMGNLCINSLTQRTQAQRATYENMLNDAGELQRGSDLPPFHLYTRTQPVLNPPAQKPVPSITGGGSYGYGYGYMFLYPGVTRHNVITQFAADSVVT